MARRTPQTQAKRLREQGKLEKRRAKDARRALRKAQKSDAPSDSVAEEAPPVSESVG